MKKCLAVGIILAAVLAVAGCSPTPQPTVTANSVESATPTGVPSLTRTSTPSLTPTITPTSTPSPTPTPSPYFGPIEFAQGVTAAGGLINPTENFPFGTKQIYAVWSYRNMRQGLAYSAKWFWNGAIWREDSYSWSVSQDSTEGTAKFIALTDQNALIPGQYRLELYIQGQLIQAATCTVGAFPTVTPSPTMVPTNTPVPTPTPTATVSSDALVRAARRALVKIWLSKGEGQDIDMGSGSLVDPRGLIVTSWHLLEQKSDVLLQTGNEVFVGIFRAAEVPPEKEFIAQVVTYSAPLDLAVLRIVRDRFGNTGPFFSFPTVQVGDSNTVDALDKIYLLGYPATNYSYATITEAVMSGRAYNQFGEFFTVDRQIPAGLDGGMVLDGRGLLIGVATNVIFSGGPPSGIGYVRPINFAKPLIDEARLRISQPPTPPPPVILLPGDHAVVTALEGLNVRSGPGLGYPVIGKAAFGAQVTVLLGPSWGDNIAWYNVLVAPTGQVGWVSGSYLRAVAPEPNPDENLLAFQSNRTGNYDIFVMRPDGTGLQNLTQHPAKDIDASWSPDRRFIAFSSDRGGDPDLYLLDLGSGITPPNVLDAVRGSGQQLHPVWAKDGEHLAYASNEDGDFEIFVSLVGGAEKRQLTYNTAWDSFPTWSPDGTEIIFTSDRDGTYELYAVNVTSGAERKLTFNAASDAFPTYSPDGQRIAFTSARTGLLEIFVADPERVETSLIQVTHSTAATQPNRYPDWSPSGGWIVFTSWRDGQAEIYLISPAGDFLKRLTTSAGEDEGPAWYR